MNFAALPPDVRKGSAFPRRFLVYHSGLRLESEAQPEKYFY